MFNLLLQFTLQFTKIINIRSKHKFNLLGLIATPAIKNKIASNKSKTVG